MLSRQSIHKTAARGRHGAVAAARSSSVEAAAAMLAAGGNAVDAAVAAALVAGVVEPMETTLGGSGFMLVGMPDGLVHSVDFGPRAPKAARADMFRIDSSRDTDRGLGISVVVDDANVQGISSVGVPATLRGLTAAQRRFGRLTLAQVMAPAIRAAHDGFEADAYFSLEVLANLSAVRADRGARGLYLTADGEPPAAPHLGTATLGAPVVIRQQALGTTLETIAARGVESFYEGDLLRALLETSRELGGLLTADDLKACQPRIGEALRIRFRDVDIWAPRAPCGAQTEFQMLRTWEALHPGQAPMQDTPERIRHFAETTWHAFADRYHWLGDPEHVPVPEQALLSPAYAAQLAASIRAGEPAPRTLPHQATPWNHYASRAAHDPWPFEPGFEGLPPRWSPAGSTEPTAGTTHVSVIDGEGMAVSITHTAANHLGAKVVCERTGILFDAAMGWFNAQPGAANSIAGGKRPLANMGPLLITRGGQPCAALGAPGGRRIVSAVVQLALNLVERNMGAEEAVHAPRFDASGSTLLLSERLQAEAAGLGDLRQLTRLVSEQHEGFGYELARPIIAVRDRDGVTEAAADPFSRGYAFAP
jgi:gamma-glutamyltranspeptidase/glutathione hydrolase